MEKYLPQITEVLFVFIFSSLLVGLGKLFQPNSEKAQNSKTLSETKMPAPWIRIAARFHSLTVLTVIFLLASLVLFPASIAYKEGAKNGDGFKMLAEFGLFLFILTLILAYAWKKGDLNWILDKEAPKWES